MIDITSLKSQLTDDRIIELIWTCHMSRAYLVLAQHQAEIGAIQPNYQVAHFALFALLEDAGQSRYMIQLD